MNLAIEICPLFLERVRHSLMPSAFQCIFAYLEDPGLLKDKYGKITVKMIRCEISFCLSRFMDIDDRCRKKKFSNLCRRNEEDGKMKMNEFLESVFFKI